MDPDDILQRQYEQLDREKREQILKLRTQEKRVDHLARAIRMEEIPLREKFIEDKLQKDREQWEKDEEDRVSRPIFDEGCIWFLGILILAQKKVTFRKISICEGVGCIYLREEFNGKFRIKITFLAYCCFHFGVF